jgi:cytochrome b561
MIDFHKKNLSYKQLFNISLHKSSGILLLSYAFERPCVPVLEPLGAAT